MISKDFTTINFIRVILKDVLAQINAKICIFTYDFILFKN